MDTTSARTLLDAAGIADTLYIESFGIAVGVAAGGALFLRRYANKGWVNKVWIQMSVPSLAFACFAIAQSLHGSGYIAAFTGGIVFGVLAGEDTHKLVIPGEGIAEALAMLTWLTFGALVIGQVIPEFTWEIVVYAVLSLTIVRIVPIFLSLTGTGESSSSKLFLGWFGPRGLASIVFAIIVIEEGLPGSRYIALVVACTVGLSLVAHGVTANPLARWIAREEN